MTGHSPRTGALVIGANYRALGVVRSLGRRGIPVRLLLHDEARIATLSRYAQRPPIAAPAEAEALLGLATSEGLAGWTLIPTDDESAFELSRERDCLSERYVVAAPAWSAMRWAHDKRMTYRLGLDHGVGQPATWFGQSFDDLARAPWQAPAILKPAIKRGRSRFIVEKAWPVADRETMRRRYDEARVAVPADEIMLQELIPGDGETQLAFAALAQGGRVLASVTARRVRQHPMDFGRESTYVETIEAPDVAELGTRVIAAMAFDGVVEVEFKRDARDGSLKLLDINPRVWGWHTLGARAGVDFSHLQWLMLQGEELPRLHGRAGVRWMRIATDVLVVPGELAARRLTPREYLASFRQPLEHATMCRDDPLAGIADLPLHALIQLQGRLHRR
jgi:D-aspartate ligase